MAFSPLLYYIIQKTLTFTRAVAIMKSRLLFFLFILFFAPGAMGQNTIGLPEIINYYKQSYKAGSQNWDIRQDKNGIMYFANNEGLLTFDGNHWELFPLPNKTNIRSLEIDKDNRIYVGGQDEFGYFFPDPNGRLVYHSLKSLVPEKERSFADVWDIFIYENDVFFRTSTKIFQFTGDKVSISSSTDWRFMGISNGRLIVQDHSRGLLQFRNGVWEPFLNETKFPKEFLVTGLLPFGKDTSLITTFRDGIYFLTGNTLSKFETPALKEIAGKLIYTASFVDNDHILLGTTLDGCFVIDKKGTLLQSFTHQAGLQNNNVLSVFFDRDKNLWLGQDTGIDFIAYDSPIKHIYPSFQNEGSGYAAIVNDHKLYIGTSNGLYFVPVYPSRDLSFVKGKFMPVDNTKGQVWNLSEVNGQLLMGHHEGAFLIKNNSATLLDNASGFWTFQPYYNVLPSSLMVTGTYNGIRLYDYKNASFQVNPAEANFESARFVTVDYADNTIWVAHPYKGLYKIKFDPGLRPAIKRYTTRNGLFSINNNYVFKIKNHIVVTTENGIYEYNNEKDSFEVSSYFKNLFSQANIHYLKEDTRGNIWFVHDKKIGVVDLSGAQPKIIYIPELTDKLVNGFEYVYPVDDNNILIGAEKGFIHINYEKYKQQQSAVQVLIRSVRAFGKTDSLLYGGYRHTNPTGKDKTGPVTIDNSRNSLHFEFSSTLYGQQANMEYSFTLKGYDNGWSEWSKKIEKEYTYLPAGTYTFQVKARNNLGNESAVESYTFTVLPPWYQTNWAYGFYTCLVFFAGYFLYRSQKKKFARQQKKYEEEQKRLQYLHQLELEKTEKEIIKLQNEKLEAEIEHKNTELASTAMHLLQKGEMMTRIKDEMTRIKKNLVTEKTSDDFKKILKTLNEENKINEDWENFAIHFDKVHSDFLTALKNKFPNLTPNELKLSAYLRMNLSSKEIAQLMNISVRGVEISRYRLRKKLQLATETNLFDFLITISSSVAKN
jgi:ligand-binding sensor domain-containing protein/DNA-binding CsgD family transcriptional regulator